MIVHLAYGEHGLDVELPDDAVVLEPQPPDGRPSGRVAGLAEPERVVEDAIEQPEQIQAAFREGTTAW